MSLETLCDLSCFSSSSLDVHLKQGFEAAFNSEIMRTSVNYSYSGILQIMALASVLGVPVETIYPIRIINCCRFTRTFLSLGVGLILATPQL